MKPPDRAGGPILQYVAPCVGAWIETYVSFSGKFARTVAPCVGAWIETYAKGRKGRMAASPPAWGRGLKRPCRFDQ